MREPHHRESSSERIRRRLQRLEESRGSTPKISPFTMISLLIILVFTLILGNSLGN